MNRQSLSSEDIQRYHHKTTLFWKVVIKRPEIRFYHFILSCMKWRSFHNFKSTSFTKVYNSAELKGGPLFKSGLSSSERTDKRVFLTNESSFSISIDGRGRDMFVSCTFTRTQFEAHQKRIKRNSIGKTSRMEGHQLCKAPETIGISICYSLIVYNFVLLLRFFCSDY